MKNKYMALLPLIIIIASLIVGALALVLSKKNDSPVEQAAEAILKTQGIDIDFSIEDEC